MPMHTIFLTDAYVANCMRWHINNINEPSIPLKGANYKLGHIKGKAEKSFEAEESLIHFTQCILNSKQKSSSRIENIVWKKLFIIFPVAYIVPTYSKEEYKIVTILSPIGLTISMGTDGSLI